MDRLNEVVAQAQVVGRLKDQYDAAVAKLEEMLNAQHPRSDIGVKLTPAPTAVTLVARPSLGLPVTERVRRLIRAAGKVGASRVFLEEQVGPTENGIQGALKVLRRSGETRLRGGRGGKYVWLGE